MSQGTSRTRPSLEVLESREVPAASPFYTGPLDVPYVPPDAYNVEISAEVTAGADHGTVTFDFDPSNPTYQYDFAYDIYPEFYGEDSFNYTTTVTYQLSTYNNFGHDDSGSSSDSGDSYIYFSSVEGFAYINIPNTPPIALSPDTTFYLDEDGVLYDEQLYGEDLNEHELTFAVEQEPQSGTLYLYADGKFDYVPDEGYFGEDSFTFTVTDPEGATSAPATVTLTVQETNSPPRASSDFALVDEDSIRTIHALDNDWDSDGDDLAVSRFTQPWRGTVTLNPNGSFDYTPPANYSGYDSFRYSVTDGQATSDMATVTIYVFAVDDPLEANSDRVSTDEDTAVTLDVLRNDRIGDGDELTVVDFSQPSNGTVSLNGDGTLTYTPDDDFNGTDSFEYEVSDGEDDAWATVSITIRPVNDAPEANDESFVTDEDSALGGRLSARDIDGDPLSFSLVVGPAHGTVSLTADGSFTYLPAKDYHGLDSFTYLVRDGLLPSNVATVSLRVRSVNDAPVAKDDVFSTIQDTRGSGSVLANDTDEDGDQLSAVLVAGPAHGRLTLNPDGSFTYVPNSGFFGQDSFTYVASDGVATGASSLVSPAVVRIAVQRGSETPPTPPTSDGPTDDVRALSLAVDDLATIAIPTLDQATPTSFSGVAASTLAPGTGIGPAPPSFGTGSSPGSSGSAPAIDTLSPAQIASMGNVVAAASYAGLGLSPESNTSSEFSAAFNMPVINAPSKQNGIAGASAGSSGTTESSSLERVTQPIVMGLGPTALGEDDSIKLFNNIANGLAPTSDPTTGASMPSAGEEEEAMESASSPKSSTLGWLTGLFVALASLFQRSASRNRPEAR